MSYWLGCPPIMPCTGGIDPRLSQAKCCQNLHVVLPCCWLGHYYENVFNAIYVPATYKVILRLVLTCDNEHPPVVYSAAPLGNLCTSTITQYLTQSHYPDTKITIPCSIRIISSSRLGSDMYILVFESHWFDSAGIVQIPNLVSAQETSALANSTIASGLIKA